jgi:hypothetical protein
MVHLVPAPGSINIGDIYTNVVTRLKNYHKVMTTVRHRSEKYITSLPGQRNWKWKIKYCQHWSQIHISVNLLKNHFQVTTSHKLDKYKDLWDCIFLRRQEASKLSSVNHEACNWWWIPDANSKHIKSYLREQLQYTWTKRHQTEALSLSHSYCKTQKWIKYTTSLPVPDKLKVEHHIWSTLITYS